MHNCEPFGQPQWVRAAVTFDVSHRPDGKLTFCSLFAGRRCLRRRWLSDHLIVHHQREFSWRCARAHALKSSHRPDGKFAHVLAPTHACTTANASVNYRRCVQQRLKTSHRPDGIFTYSYVSRLCLQGGGVFVNGGTVTLSSCTITGNTAISVRAHAQNFPSPP